MFIPSLHLVDEKSRGQVMNSDLLAQDSFFEAVCHLLAVEITETNEFSKEISIYRIQGRNTEAVCSREKSSQQ